MYLAAGKLYKEFQGTKSMSGWIQIKVGKVLEATPGVYYAKDEDGSIIARALALFDMGSDRAGVTSTFPNKHKLSKLSNKSLSLITVSGLERKSFCRYRLKILTK